MGTVFQIPWTVIDSGKKHDTLTEEDKIIDKSKNQNKNQNKDQNKNINKEK